MSLPNSSPKHPTCGVVVQKAEGAADEVICDKPAADLISIVDPIEQSKVTAVVLVCTEHSQALDHGKVLIFKAEDGEQHIAVQYAQPEEVANVSPNESQ